MQGANAAAAIIPWGLIVSIIGVGITSLCALGGMLVFVLKVGKWQGKVATRLTETESDIEKMLDECDKCEEQRAKVEGELFDLNRKNIAALASIQASLAHVSKQVDHIQDRVDTNLNGGGHFAKP